MGNISPISNNSQSRQDHRSVDDLLHRDFLPSSKRTLSPVLENGFPLISCRGARHNTPTVEPRHACSCPADGCEDTSSQCHSPLIPLASEHLDTSLSSQEDDKEQVGPLPFSNFDGGQGSHKINVCAAACEDVDGSVSSIEVRKASALGTMRSHEETASMHA